MKARSALVCGIAVLLSNGSAAAKETKADDHFLPEWISVGVGFVGQVGGNFFDKPDDQTVLQGVPVESDYPGFAGLTRGFGPTLDIRFLGFVGIEMDILFTRDVGEADMEFTRTGPDGSDKFDYTIEIGHDAVHLPLLLKGSIPGEYVQPILFLGPEFVFPSDPHFAVLESNVPGGGTAAGVGGPVYGTAATESYTMFTFGLGLEIMLPIPSVDIRIPFSLRGSYNPGASDKRDERGDHVVNGTDLQSENFATNWKFQAVANFGAGWHF
jgi:hypothetical protein